MWKQHYKAELCSKKHRASPASFIAQSTALRKLPNQYFRLWRRFPHFAAASQADGAYNSVSFFSIRSSTPKLCISDFIVKKHRNYSVSQKRCHLFFESNCQTCIMYYNISSLVLQHSVWKKQPASILTSVQAAILLILPFLPRYTRRRRWPRCAYRRTP